MRKICIEIWNIMLMLMLIYVKWRNIYYKGDN